MIVEDDTPEVSVSETALTITEGDAQSYTVVLGTEPAADVTVVVAVPEDADIAVDETTLTFTADNWGTPQTVTVTAAQDDDAVDDEPVVLTHAVSGGDYEGVTASEVTVTIIEDDTPTLTIADANVTEGDEEITFTVMLSVASSLAVTVDWATADGTATQGADYAETTGTLSFDALETEQTLTVPLLDDALDEADETFTLALSNPANATIDDAEAIGTIVDNDDGPDPDHRRRGGSRRRPGNYLCSNARSSQQFCGNSRLDDRGRHGNGGRGLHRGRRPSDLRARPDRGDRRGGGVQRRARRSRPKRSPSR